MQNNKDKVGINVYPDTNVSSVLPFIAPNVSPVLPFIAPNVSPVSPFIAPVPQIITPGAPIIRSNTPLTFGSNVIPISNNPIISFTNK
jgi:hypothetical protein